MRKIISVLAAIAVAVPAFAETDYVAVKRLDDIKNGVNNQNQIQKLRVQDTATVGERITSYGYAVSVGASATSVYLTQVGTNNCVGTSSTNVFPVTFIETPKVFVRYYAAGATNVALTVASNSVIRVGDANVGEWMAFGRIK